MVLYIAQAAYALSKQPAIAIFHPYLFHDIALDQANLISRLRNLLFLLPQPLLALSLILALLPGLPL